MASFQDFNLPAAASTFLSSAPAAVSTLVPISAPSAILTLVTITASFFDSDYDHTSSQFTDFVVNDRFSARDDTEFEVASKQVIRFMDDPQNSTSSSASNSTASYHPRTNRTTQAKLAVAITVVLLVFIFSILIAFEYGKRVALKALSSRKIMVPRLL
ncbi:hypothetical protein EG329_008325 [Mollisiaceae sp. DMI_Dod_QoI]|nr:hypothetical protein EG329_008325 [Helotiales sp. DMI_Dod_QoI]